MKKITQFLLIVFIIFTCQNLSKAQNDWGDEEEMERVVESSPLTDKLIIGLNLEFNFFGKNNSIIIGASPMIGYRFLKKGKAVVGITPKYYNVRYHHFFEDDIAQGVGGVGIFAYYEPQTTINIYPYVEYGFLKYKVFENERLVDRKAKGFLLLGAGFKRTLINDFGFRVEALLDVLHNSDSPFFSLFRSRVGVFYEF